uniref:Ig-like domain-containing protein n=1 Tax=Gadus morhua TaxID=8049 RepID=A0A8C5A8P6_GADMO
MTLISAARGFLAFLLSVPVLQGNDDWTVTYSSNVCALRGAKVEINCTYEYSDNVQYRPTTVTTLWFTKEDNHQPVDLEHDTDYTGRVESSCGEVSCSGSRCHETCTLRIKDLRQSDSAVYKFRFTTNQPGGEYTEDPGVTLSVTDLQVKVSFPDPTNPTGAELECHSMCGLAGDPPYIWFRNGQNVRQGVNYRAYIQSEESYSCAVQGCEHLHSPLVCKSPPPYTDMIPDVMDSLGYRTTCYHEPEPVQNEPLQNGPIAWPPVLLLAALLNVTPLKYFTLDTALPVFSVKRPRQEKLIKGHSDIQRHFKLLLD